MRFKVFDYAAFVLAVAVVIVFAVYAYGETGEGSVARVETERDEFVYTLQQSQEVDFEGPLGRTHVEIHEGRVRVTDSPCREKICVASGWASRSGEWIACLPNRIFIRVEGGEEQPVDAQTY
ncbi:MAG: NusG domain II-containing protein [bacterium]